MIEVDFTKLSKQRYAMSHDWDLLLPFDSMAIFQMIRDDKDSKYLMENLKGEDSFKLRCKSSTLPTTQVTTEQVTVYGVTTNVVTSAKANGSITLTFLEGDKYELYKFFSAWRELGASSRTDAIGGIRRNVSVDGVTLAMGIQKDRANWAMTFKLNGVQPTEVSLSQPSNNIEFMTLTVTLKYDDYRIASP